MAQKLYVLVALLLRVSIRFQFQRKRTVFRIRGPAIERFVPFRSRFCFFEKYCVILRSRSTKTIRVRETGLNECQSTKKKGKKDMKYRICLHYYRISPARFFSVSKRLLSTKKKKKRKYTVKPI